MAIQQFFTPWDSSTLANYYAWANGLSGAIVASGWTRITTGQDPGVVVWANVASALSTYTSASGQIPSRGTAPDNRQQRRGRYHHRRVVFFLGSLCRFVRFNGNRHRQHRDVQRLDLDLHPASTPLPARLRLEHRAVRPTGCRTFMKSLPATTRSLRRAQFT